MFVSLKMELKMQPWILKLLMFFNCFMLVIVSDNSREGQLGSDQEVVRCLGCPENAGVDEDVLVAAKFATSKGLVGNTAIDECGKDNTNGGIELVQVEKVKKQVVAGTNYFLTLRLKTNTGQDCENKVEKICENIVVFKDLPLNCKPNEECLKLIRQKEISCVCQQVPDDREVQDSEGCGEVDGEVRQDGDTWKDKDGCNTCTCYGSETVCTEKYCEDRNLVDECSENEDCMAPGGECEHLADAYCECINHHCEVRGGFPLSQEEEMRGTDEALPSLFTAVADPSARSLVQCTGEGKTSCKKINIDKNVLDDLRVGDKVKLLEDLPVTLSLRFDPDHGSSTTSTSYIFTTGDGGEALITVGNDRPSVYGSVKPSTGDVHYVMESCGNNCNIMAERDAGYFNNFED